MNTRFLIGFALVAVALIFFPSVITALNFGNFWITLLFRVFIWSSLALSWNFFCGYSGYSSFGHGAFFGIGMYTTSTLMLQFQVPFLLTLPLAGLMSALVAAAVGAVVFRIPRFRGELFSLITLALTFIVLTVVSNIREIDGGAGVFLNNADVPDFISQSNLGTYYLGLLIVLPTVLVAYLIYISRWGQALFAIRDDEDAADGLGIPTYRYKLMTFALSSFVVGVVGGVEAIYLGYFEPTGVFAILTPLLALMMAILGGAGTWYGPIIGAVIITSMRQTLTSADTAVLNQIIIGMVLVLVILFIPEGISGWIERKLRDRSLQVKERTS